MFINKFLAPQKVDEVNTQGQFIKVMNCENTLRIRATSKGQLVFDSEVKAGFDVQTSEPFDLLTITSDTEQKLELWVSKHKLSYDALSTKASRSSSFIVEHFGQSQVILPYDPGQSSAKVASSGAGFWVGGEGVSSDSGIYVAQGEVYSHNSSSPLYAFVNGFPDRVFDGATVSKLNAPNSPASNELGALNGGMSIKENGNNFNTVLTNLKTGVSIDIGRQGITSGTYEPYLDGFMGLFNGHGLVVVESDGSVRKYPNQLDRGGFSARCCVEGVGGAFVLGQPLQGELSKVFYLSGGAWAEVACPASLIEKSIFHAFKDSVDGTLWLVTSDNELFYSRDDMLTAAKVEGVSVDYSKQLKMSFSADAVMLVAKGFCKVIYRQDLSFFDLDGKAPDIKGGLLLGEQWLVVSSNTVYSSSDRFNSYNEAYINDVDFSAVAQMIYENDGRVYLESPAAVGVDIISAKLKIDDSNPVEKIRVFKESF